MVSVRLAVALWFAVGAASGCTPEPLVPVTGGDVERGRDAIHSYGCGACHRIPGVPGAAGTAGPPLEGVARRAYLAGVLPNSPANMRLWILTPRVVDPPTAMPDLGVTEADARDMTAYLYTLK